MAYSSGQEWAEQRNFKTVLSTARFIQNWNLRDSAARANYVVSEIFGKKINFLPTGK